MIQAYAHSDTGPVRTVNEDSWLIQPDLGLYAVADGMGGHNAGEIASRLVVESLPKMVRKRIAPDTKSVSASLARWWHGFAR